MRPFLHINLSEIIINRRTILPKKYICGTKIISVGITIVTKHVLWDDYCNFINHVVLKVQFYFLWDQFCKYWDQKCKYWDYF